MDAATYNEITTLKNGITANIRSIRTDDKSKISEAFRNLETETIYTRFFTHKKALTDDELKTITEIDFESVVALVVTIGNGEDEIIIAGGRYAVFGNADHLSSAEVAFTVEEDYQGQGIASSLLKHLTHIARNKGLTQFEAEVLSGNNAMLKVFARSGLPMKKKYEDGVVHVTLSLSETVS